jgi:hypothetical protein
MTDNICPFGALNIVISSEKSPDDYLEDLFGVTELQRSELEDMWMDASFWEEQAFVRDVKPCLHHASVHVSARPGFLSNKKRLHARMLERSCPKCRAIVAEKERFRRRQERVSCERF